MRRSVGARMPSRTAPTGCCRGAGSPSGLAQNACELRVPSQIERCRCRGIRRLVVHGQGAERMAVRPEAGETSRLRFVRIHRKGVVVAAARMADMIRAAAERA